MLAVGAGFGCQLEERDLTIVDWMSFFVGKVFECACQDADIARCQR